MKLGANLHFWMHAAVNYWRKSTGWAGRDHTIPSWWQYRLLILVESFQWRVLARALQLVTTRISKKKTLEIHEL